jgi:4-diphosphocytidyl-2-C-methyl-D-erythritol kinase
MQAGLGGGSSDAAAALRALGRLWGVSRSRQRLIAMALGADVPFFLEGGTALGVDRGDLLFPLPDLAPSWVVVALPPFGVSTKDAFGWFDACAVDPGRRGVRSAGDLDWRNDLQDVVARRHPELAGLVRALKRSGASRALMSGSGSAIVGLFMRRPGAVAAAAHVEARFPGTRAVLSRTLDRSAHRRLAGA